MNTAIGKAARRELAVVVGLASAGIALVLLVVFAPWYEQVVPGPHGDPYPGFVGGGVHWVDVRQPAVIRLVPAGRPVGVGDGDGTRAPSGPTIPVRAGVPAG